MDPQIFRTKPLDAIKEGEKVRRILAAAVEAVEPAGAVRRHVQRDGDRLSIGGRDYDLGKIQRVLVVGAGKAGAPMAEAVAEILGDRLTSGIVLVKEGHIGSGSPAKFSQSWQGLRILEAGHPVPDQRGVEGANQIIELLKKAQEDDLVISLISGGGSALMTCPEEPVSLEDLRAVTGALLTSGANINEINALRKHLEGLKGGKLARLAAPAHTATLILSDVVGDPLDVIASGPTVPDNSTFEDAFRVLERYGLMVKAPEAVLARLQKGMRGEVAENPRPDDLLFQKVHNAIIASNMLAARAAVEQARREGFHAMLLTTYLQGEARQAGRVLAAITRQIVASGQPLERPACVVIGGETTVTLQGDGLGGRNQEMALAAVRDMAGLPQAAMICLATDGGDGPTAAAGAVVTGDTLARASQLGLAPAGFLERNDAFHFFEPLGDLLKTGPTRTNVNDLAFIFAF